MTNKNQITFSDIKQEETSFDVKVFNTQKSDYYTPKVFSGQPPGVFNTITLAYPKIETYFKKLKAQDWDEQETLENSDSKQLFEILPEKQTQPMIRTLGFQWETDTIIGRTLAIFGAMGATSDQLFEIYMRIVDNENLHARTYSEIIKMSFDDVEKVLTDILNARETIQRLSKAGEVFSRVRRMLCEVELGIRQRDEYYYRDIYLMLVTIYCVERIQFLSSFAITFLYGENGLFMEICNSVKRICQDEYEIHVRLGRFLIQNYADDAITHEGVRLAQPFIKEILDEIFQAEMVSLDYQMETVKDEGLFGKSVSDIQSWVKFCSTSVYNLFEIETPYEKTDSHRLDYMKNWVNIDDFQQSPQEEASIAYIMAPLIRDDKNKVYEIKF